MSPNYFDLDIDFPYVNPSPELAVFYQDYVNPLPRGEFLTSELMKFIIVKHQLVINTAAVFYSKPNVETPIHVDGPLGDYAKLNFVLGGRNSKMNWYNLKDPANVPPIKKTSLKTDYISYDYSDLDFIDEYEFYRPTIVQVGIPHNVTNGPDHRYCISLSLMQGRQRLTMDRARDIFSKYIKK